MNRETKLKSLTEDQLFCGTLTRACRLIGAVRTAI